ncbi:MAG: hypothetical protein ACLFVE_12590 [Chitinispirillaceae bacterium]
MKNVWTIFPDYDLARYGTGTLFKEKVADRNDANVIVHAKILTESPSTGNFKEISGDAVQKGEGGDISELPQMKSEELPWLDHFLADCTIINMSDTGSIGFAGEKIEGFIKGALVEGKGSLGPVLRKAGLAGGDSSEFVSKISQGGVMLWINVMDDKIPKAEELLKKSKAEPIRII